MEEINKIIGKNLLRLRKNAKLTQVELADTFNYSDKSVSKWETGESLPSVEVLYDVAKFYNVTLNDLVNDNEEELIKTEDKKKKEHNFRLSAKLIITLLSVMAVWLVATATFACLKICLHINYYMCFLWAVPASCIVLIVFNSIWGRYRYLFMVLSVMIWSTLACLQVQLLISIGVNVWPIYIIGVPLQIAVLLWGALVKRPKDYYKEITQE